LAATNLPTVEMQQSEIDAGIGVLAAFVKAGLVVSNSEARRQVQGGGVKVNDRLVTNDKAVINADDVKDGVVKLSLGKKKHVLLKQV